MSSGNVNVELERSLTGVGIRKVAQWINAADFTDGGAADGTLTLDKEIPAGSFVVGSKVKVAEGFDAGGTAVMDIGTAADPDLFSVTTHDIETAADNLVEGADVAAAGGGTGIVPVNTAVGVLLTVTEGGGDFTLIGTTGRMYVEVFYLSTNVELVDKADNKLNR